MTMDNLVTEIPVLGAAKIPSPILRGEAGDNNHGYVTENDRILVNLNAASVIQEIQSGRIPPSYELAGPQEKIYFDPSKVRCALVTCGGLCPGLNDIIRAIVLQLHYGYGVRNIYGIRYGLQGFIPEYGHPVLDLNPDCVANIHEMGGSILGSSRGPQPIEAIIDCLERMNIGILFMIGGDGTLRAATQIGDAITQSKLNISVVGIPKTIDNDIYMVARSFGFDTAVSEATRAVRAAHNESAGYPNGIGLIKLMGRYSGFIAATTALAQQDVNFVLVPEVDFDLDGPHGLMRALENRLTGRAHAVIVVAEGAGQKFFVDDEVEHDESGNVRLKDIGLFLKHKIAEYFHSKNIPITIKYIDPSYTIRSLPASANDNVFCNFLGRNAVHAGMAGKTMVLVGRWNNHFVHVPMSVTVGKHKQIDPDGKLWRGVLDATGQGSLKNNL